MVYFLSCLPILVAIVSLTKGQALLSAKESKKGVDSAQYATKVRQMELKLKQNEDKMKELESNEDKKTQNRVTEQTLMCDERIKKIENFIAQQSFSNEYYGGSGGSMFNDVHWWEYRRISGLRMVCDADMLPITHTLHGLQIKYGSDWAPRRGNAWRCANHNNESLSEFTFDSDEKITKVEVTFGVSDVHGPSEFIHFLTITTNKRVLPTCGRQQPERDRKTVVLSGHRLDYISGRDSCYLIDGLKFHWSN